MDSLIEKARKSLLHRQNYLRLEYQLIQTFMFTWINANDTT